MGAIDVGSFVTVTSLKPNLILPERSRHFLAADICLALSFTPGMLAAETVETFFELFFLAGVLAISQSSEDVRVDGWTQSY